MEPSDLIFNSDPNKGIYSGGFSIKNYFLNSGISPITTINQQGGDSNQNGGSKVADIFNNLVVPAPLYYKGGLSKFKHVEIDEEEDEVIDDKLYNELLQMVSKTEKKKTRKIRVANKQKTQRRTS
jgi:hypothetical protein